jgi:hypothetical protein
MFTSCGSNGGSSGAAERANDAQDWFTESARRSGLDFVHFNGMSGEFYFPETIPPGVALFDHDADGDLDVFAAQGQMLGKKPLSEALYPPRGPLKSRLYRNDLELHSDGTRTLRFTDITDDSGILTRGYAMGAATGDFNNDGCIDLYVTNLERSQLFRNDCDGTFTDVSAESRTEDRGWTVSAAFVDYDRDGWLDLFVGNYVNYSVDANLRCISVIGSLDYCPPRVYRAQPSHLFHNDRDGTFTDVTVAAGTAREFGPALGVSTADFNADGWIDIYVANDGAQNQLWINQHDGTFKNMALFAGAALSPEGQAKASMGVDAGDFDNDGDEDLFITELLGQGHYLFVNNGSGVFEDRAADAGILRSSLPYTGFGAAWIDFDNDGWLDILTVNGAVTHNPEALARNETFSLQQPKQLFRNLGNGRFEDVTTQAGAVLRVPQVGRGAAFGDVDNDGDTDVVVANDSGPIELLVNNIGDRKHWVGLRLVRRQPARDIVGARVTIAGATIPTLGRRARADGSYASANDPRVLVGLGDSASIGKVRVDWPGGTADEWTGVPVDRYTTLTEGEGR